MNGLCAALPGGGGGQFSKKKTDGKKMQSQTNKFSVRMSCGCPAGVLSRDEGGGTKRSDPLHRFPGCGLRSLALIHASGRREPVLFINESNGPAQCSYISPRIQAQPRLQSSDSQWTGGVRRSVPVEEKRVISECLCCGRRLFALCPPCEASLCGSVRSLRRQAPEWLLTGGVSLDTLGGPANQSGPSGGRLGNGGRMERPRVDELLMSLSFTKTERNFRSGSSECKQTEELQAEGRKRGREE